MSRVKCPECGEWFKTEEIEDFVFYKKRYYHKHCHYLVAATDAEKEKTLEYICKILELKTPGPRIFAQLKKYLEEDGYTYQGIYEALYYFFDIKQGDVSKARGGIGIVPYVYAEAEKYFVGQRAREEKAKRLAIQAERIQASPTKIVVSKFDTSTRKKVKMIDLEELV